MRALVADDEPTIRLLLSSFLARYGEVDTVENGRLAVEAFTAAFKTKAPYDMLCMDIVMPEVDGREAVRQIRALERTRNIPRSLAAKIIMITALDEVEALIRGSQDPYDAYLIKPVNLTELLGHMRVFHLVK